MNPKKSKDFIEEIGENLDLDKQLLEDLIDFYYKECRQVLSNLKCTRLDIQGLGHFVSRKNLVNKAVTKCTKSLKNHDTSTFAAYYNKKNLETKLELLKDLMLLHNQEKDRKNKFKDGLKKDMEE
tara:strand:- start:478 stop:852 length:375 start_codon:yes stop_codon:yes gene_type:complete